MNKEKIILNKHNIKKKLLIFIEKNIKIGDNYKTNIKELEKLKNFLMILIIHLILKYI